MPTLNKKAFDALWDRVQSGPAFTPAAGRAPVRRSPPSLTTLLEGYLASAQVATQAGKLAIDDFHDLTAAIGALQAVLGRIDDKGMVEEWATERAKFLSQPGA